MRVICDTQIRFKFYHSNSKMSKKLKKISEILQKDMSFLKKLGEDFKTPKGSSAGAKGMTIEQVVRVAILKQLRQLGYEKLYDELSDNINYRRFAKIHEGEVPKKMTLNENVSTTSVAGGLISPDKGIVTRTPLREYFLTYLYQYSNGYLVANRFL